MATQRIISEGEFLADVPTSGIMLLKRFPHPFVTEAKYQSLMIGEHSAGGPFSVDKMVVDTPYGIGSRIAVGAAKGDMLVFNLAVPERRLHYAILSKCDQFKRWIAKDENKKAPGSIYYFFNPQKDAEDWLKAEETKLELNNSINRLDDDGLMRMGVLFGISGSNQIIKVGLMKLAANAEGRKKLSDVFYSPDREVLELIAVAESKGNASKKEGLWKHPISGIYSWNNTAIGLGKESVVAYMKKENVLYNELRRLYLWKGEDPLQANKTSQILSEVDGHKVQAKSELPAGMQPLKPNHNCPWVDSEQLKADYEAGMKFKDLSEKHKDPEGNPTNHLSLRRVLINMGVIDDPRKKN